jgi:polyferredoxin
MSLLWLILVLVVVGVVLWLVNTYIPMEPAVKSIMNVIVIIAIIVWFAFYLLGGVGHFPGP